MTTRASSKPAPHFLWAFMAIAISMLIVGGLLGWSYGVVPERGLKPVFDFEPVTGFEHLHALAIDPSDPSMVWVATHDGVVRGVNDTGWGRAGIDHRDIYALAIHPTDSRIMWSAGRDESGLKPTGFRTSEDGGFTWGIQGLKEHTLFAMTVSPVDPTHMWAYERGIVISSANMGLDWGTATNRLPPVNALAADAADADTVWFATEAGLMVSRDGGLTAETVRAGDTVAVAAQPADPRVLLIATGHGEVLRTLDSGASWVPLNATIPGEISAVAIHPRDASILYVGTLEGGLWKSEDAGANWRILMSPTP